MPFRYNRKSSNCSGTHVRICVKGATPLIVLHGNLRTLARPCFKRRATLIRSIVLSAAVARRLQRASPLLFFMFSMQFVAHPYSQLMLNSKLYNDLESWKDLNFVIKILVGFFFASLLPLWFLIYFFAPNSHLSQLLKKPFFKFLNHGGSFVWFLALLICSSIQDKFFNVLEFSPLGK